MKKEKMILLGALLVAFAVASIAPVMADPAGASVVGSITEKGPYSSTNPGTIDVISGKIYLANVTGNMSTYHWAGVYGNATGYLILGDTSGNKMFEWTAKANYVYFSDNTTTISWTSVSNATCGDIGTKYTFISDSNGASDSCSKTFTQLSSLDSKIFGTISNINSALTNPSWYTLALKDGNNNNIVFAGKTVDDGTAFDGTIVNYQVILPEDGESGNSGATTYYMWLELY